MARRLSRPSALFGLVLSLGTVSALIGCGSSEAGAGGPGVGDSAGGQDTTTGDTPVVDAPGAGDGAGSVDVPGQGGDEGPCTIGTTRCASQQAVEVCTDGRWVVAQTCSAPLVCAGGVCQSGGGTCTPGVALACVDERTVQRCNAGGDGVESERCAEGLFCLAGQCGAQRCVPGTTACRDASTVQVCAADGLGFELPQSCGAGAVCVGGRCLTGCDGDYKIGSYVGCEYYTVDLDQTDRDPTGNPEPLPHAVVIANPGLAPALLTFQSFSSIPVSFVDAVVPAGGLKVFEMPRMDLDGHGVFNRSVRIRSNRPVLASQFNPLNDEGVFSNDGTLLLPTAVLGREYRILSWPSSAGLLTSPPRRGYFTIVAVAGGTTEVGVQVTADTDATMDAALNDVVRELPAYARGQTAAVRLEQGQVLQIQARPPAGFAGGADLTGSRVFSDKPILVFSGHEAAGVDGIWVPPGPGEEPRGNCCLEHLEEVMLPIQALGNEVLCGKAATRGREADVWRIVAIDPVTLDTEPPQKVDETGARTVRGLSLQPGEWIQIKSADSFLTTATGRILVGQYLTGQDYTDKGIGDPALIHGIPIAQWSRDYPILVPADYEEDWLTILRRAGDEVRVDGTPVPDGRFDPVGTTGYEVGTLRIQPGPHQVTSTEPFGLVMTGYSFATSYGLAAGMDIADLVTR